MRIALYPVNILLQKIYKKPILRDMTTPAQIRAARALLDWTQADLAAKAGISPTSINTIEREKGDPKLSTVSAIRRALEEAGVEFTDGDAPGVRLRRRAA
jgi:DNA-binding XRE family transcriptional regulator